MRRTTWILVLLILAAGCSGDSGKEGKTVAGNVVERIKVNTRLPEAPALDPEVAELARRYTTLFYNDQLGILYENFSPEMQERGMSQEQLSALREYVRENYGSETELIGEESQTNDAYRAVVRWARFELTEDVIQIKWYLRDDDSIAGFFVGPSKRPDGSEGG